MPNINPQRRELLEGIERAVAELSRHVGAWDDGIPDDARRDITRIRDMLERLMVRAGRRAGPTIGTKE